MQFKKLQSELIRDIIENSNDIKFMKKTKTEHGYKELYVFLGCPGDILIFEKRGNHRYWTLEESK